MRRTTSSLEALKLFTRSNAALDNGRLPEATALLERAVELDTAFASAHRKLGVTLNWIGRTSAARESYRRAYEHKDRLLTDFERTGVVALFHWEVRGDVKRAAAEYEAYLARHPDRKTFNNLVAAYLRLGEYEKAEEAALKLVEAMPDNVRGYWHGVQARLAQGELDAAEDLLRRNVEVLPDHPGTIMSAVRLAYSRGRYEEADSILLEAVRNDAYGAWVQAGAYEHLAWIRAVRGRIAEADSLFGESVRLRSSFPGSARQIKDGLSLGLFRLFVAGDTVGALTGVESTIERVGGDSLPAWDVPHHRLAAFYAFAGEVHEARRHLGRGQATLEAEGADLAEEQMLWPPIARGALALAEGRRREAVRHFEAALRVPDSFGCGGEACALGLLARAKRSVGDAQGELRALERYVSLSGAFDFFWDALFLGSALERLGALYDRRGDPQTAARYYARFIELWKNADEMLLPRVDAARARLEQIVAESS